MQPKQQLEAAAKEHDVKIQIYRNTFPYIIWKVPTGYKLMGLVDSTIIKLLPRKTNDGAFNKFADLVDTRG